MQFGVSAALYSPPTPVCSNQDELTWRCPELGGPFNIYIQSTMPAVFKAGAFVSPVVEVPLASLGGAAGTEADPFSYAIPAANLPEPNRYAVKVAAVNANGAGAWSSLSEVAVYGELLGCWGVWERHPDCMPPWYSMAVWLPSPPARDGVQRCSALIALSMCTVAAGVPKAPSGVPTVTLVDPSVRVTLAKADSTAIKYSAFLKPASGDEVEVPLAVKPVSGSTTQLFAMVAPDPPELPQGAIYTLQARHGHSREACDVCSGMSAAGLSLPGVNSAIMQTCASAHFASLAGDALPNLQIAAYNANGDLGARSSASAAFQLGTVAPSAPLAVTSASATPLTASLSFQAPASNGGSPITRCVCHPRSGQWGFPA